MTGHPFIDGCMALAAFLVSLAATGKAIAAVWAQRNKSIELRGAPPARASLPPPCAAPCEELRGLRREFEYHRGVDNGRHSK